MTLQAPVRARLPLAPRRGAGYVISTPGRLGVLLTNSFEGGTSGTALTTGNTGGASRNAASQINNGSGHGSIKFDNTYSAHGNLSCHITESGTADRNSFQWNLPASTLQNQYWFRMYCYFAAAPTNTHRILLYFNAAGGGDLTINATSAGQIQVQNNGATLYNFTNGLPINQWFRLEGYQIPSVTAGQIEVQLFVPMDSPTSIEKYTSAANLNTSTTVSGPTFGLGGASVANVSFWMDDIGLSNTGYIGPASLAAPLYPLIRPVRAPLPAQLPARRLAGTVYSNPGALVDNPAPGPPFYPPHWPVQAKRLQLRGGTAHWRYGPIPPPPVFIPGTVTITRAGPLAAVLTVSQP